ncbi:monooxygenase FAD-binding [Catenulispora acidiphila DSM 44928]|uniref:Monooxygenase FAD-binding n=1 Tax=Catenulispora acidiphila (strain DSM 44928 / JCM 14897 / NBRC 102108 / NRRL B-24433 / ID139908) TaxID=479433 RepID=C7Q6L1_CATAD|nr:FAD-dependent monooxygenase [Catenulispora acidiphila]ACU74046.1 monooxygenase FAD-binding [Catenulispora acidiphila DSM 44928]
MRIGVVGGSIAGCAGALAAARAVPEAAVVVFERSAGALRDRGAGIGIQHERFGELAAAGFLDASLPATANDAREWYVWDGGSGDRRKGGGSGGRGNSDGGGTSGLGKMILRQPFPFDGYNWGHLYRSLRGRLPSRVEYRGDARVMSVTPTESGASVTLTDGGVEHFDLLLGADGYRSVVREAMFPGVVPDYAGYLCWRGLSDFAQIEGLPHGAFFTVGFPHGHLVAYPIPADDGRVHFNWVLYATVPPEVTGDLRTATSIPPGAVSDALLDFMDALLSRELPPLWAEAIRKTAREDVFIQPIYDFEVPAYAKHRMLLLGDAGAVSRPHAGAGSVKAMQDAAALLDLWSTAADRSDLGALAARYDAARRPPGHAIATLARRIGEAQVLDTPDWSAFEEATFVPWLAALTAMPDGTELGGRRL